MEIYFFQEFPFEQVLSKQCKRINSFVDANESFPDSPKNQKTIIENNLYDQADPEDPSESNYQIDLICTSDAIPSCSGPHKLEPDEQDLYPTTTADPTNEEGTIGEILSVLFITLLN